MPGSGQWTVGSAHVWGTGGAANPHLRRGLLGFGCGTVVARTASAGLGNPRLQNPLTSSRKEVVLGKQIKFCWLLTNEPPFPDAIGGLP